MTIDHSNKLDFFKQHFVNVLTDLQENGTKDGEAMAMIGSLAQTIIAAKSQQTWAGFKLNCTEDDYNALLKVFETKGNAAHQQGQVKQGYAIQALSTALVASRLRSDEAIRIGEPLLDEIIEQAIVFYDTFKDNKLN